MIGLVLWQNRRLHRNSGLRSHDSVVRRRSNCKRGVRSWKRGRKRRKTVVIGICVLGEDFIVRLNETSSTSASKQQLRDVQDSFADLLSFLFYSMIEVPA